MSTQPRASFAHYEIVSPIGSGGMGEVFLARDTKLDRQVAIKFLNEKFSQDEGLLNRFKQEAKAASALNHPNILTVYEIGENEGRHYISSEYIDGSTLRERMKSRLSFDETLSIVVQTAEALSAAHQAGIVHRDIKPENIMVRADGYVKVLDFGLAKLTEIHESADGEEETRKLVKTNPGVVMGTVTYMSPEQARGKPTDARSDVFSFGVVLYEMLTGKVPFAGETVTDVLSSIISTEPQPITSIAEHLPRELQRIVQKTLKKKRDQRYHALTRAATGLRERLGESLSSIEKFNVPSESITTSSLEALKIFVLGREQIVNGRQFEAIPFYKKALELDPNFALAYTELAVVYRNTDQWSLAAEMTGKAYELRDAVSESEKLRITYYYHNFVNGELDKAIDTLELWRNTYPNFVVSYVSLSDSMERIGQSEKAVAFAREGIRIDPNYATIYMNLVESLVSLGRNQEARETCKTAFERNLDGTYFHLFPLIISFIENDREAIDKDLRWFAGRDDEHIAFDVQARAASVKGQWRTAQDYSRRSVDLATHTNASEVAGKYAAEQAVRVVFWSSGTGLPAKDDATLRSVLKAQTNKALSLERGQMVVVTIALALAVAGQSDEASRLLDDLFAARPNDTLLKHLWAPTIKAALWLQAGKLKEAVEELEITERLEKAGEFIPQYLRGLALLRLDRNREAAREFDKILNNRGEAPLSSLYPLAHLGKARALKDKAEYEKFLEMWKDADKDMPALVAARAEFEALG